MSELVHLLGDWPHWAFEFIADSAFTAVAFVIGRVPFRKWLARHDKERHGV